MGDRCYWQAIVHPEDVDCMAAILGDGPDEEGGNVFTFDEMNYAGISGLEDAAEQGLRVIGDHGAGDAYGPGLFAIWNGELHEVDCDYSGGFVVRVDEHGKPDPDGLAALSAYAEARDHVQLAMADETHEQEAPACGHSSCRQHWIDTGRTSCLSTWCDASEGDV